MGLAGAVVSQNQNVNPSLNFPNCRNQSSQLAPCVCLKSWFFTGSWGGRWLDGGATVLDGVNPMDGCIAAQVPST